MAISNLGKLAVLIDDQRDALLAYWRAQVRKLPSAAGLDTPTLNDHIPDLLDELAEAFRLMKDEAITESLIEGSPPDHGRQRFHSGFDIVEVVAEYNILRGCIHDLAESHGLSLQGKAFHILNRVLDGAIGLAVQTFSIEQALAVQRRREEYLALVAHDLRTPLNAISLATGVLEIHLSGPSGTAPIVKMLKSLQRNVNNLNGLVQAVLKENEHVRTESGVKLERRLFDLWPLVESLLLDLKPLASTANTVLANRIPEDLIAFADAALLHRVFQNLISNAIRYTPQGEIAIGAQERASDGVLECWVADTGAGIPADRIGKVFEKFESGPDSEEGIGLGLAIVKSFVEAHGGTVVVESEEGAGSTFRFTLPLGGRGVGD